VTIAAVPQPGDPAGGAASAVSPGTADAGEPCCHDVVLLHGQPGSADDWQSVVARLPSGLRVIAADRPGYGSNPLPAAGFAANARSVIDQLDALGIPRAVLVGHSYGGGVALSAAALAPHRVAGLVLLASVGPGCVTGWDRLLAAPGAGPLCALAAWRLTPWIARARLASLTRRRGRPITPGEHVNWQIWAQAAGNPGRLWRTFLTEQRALVRELDEVMSAVPAIRAPVLVLADPKDAVVRVRTARLLADVLPDGRLQLVDGAGHHLPRRVPDVVADAISGWSGAATVRRPGCGRDRPRPRRAAAGAGPG
jgi:pimeloyl-ACP methyl ester carboxylesterase